MSQLDYIHVYLFDIFEKTKYPVLIEKLNQLYGPSKGESSTILALGSTKNVNETKKRWQLQDLEKTITDIEKICKEKMIVDLSLTRLAVKKIEMIGIESDDLPYSVLVMSASIDASKLDFGDLFHDVNNILRPLRIYMEEFNGIVKQLFMTKPICPYFVDVGVQSSKDEIKDMITTFSELLSADGIGDESVKLDYTIPRSAKLRKIAPLNSMIHSFNLLSMAKIFSNIGFFGYLEQAEFNGLMTPFAVTFREEKIQELEYWDTKSLNVRPGGYETLTTPVGRVGMMIYLVSMFAWLLHLKRIVEDKEPEFVQLRKNIRDLIRTNKKLDLEKHLIDLDKNGSFIADFISELGSLKRQSDNSVKDFLKAKSAFAIELPILPATASDLQRWSSIRESTASGAYIQGLAKKNNELLEKIRITLDQYIYENEKLHIHVNNLVNIRSQKTMKIHNNVMLFSTFTIAGLTLVLAFIELSRFGR